MGWQGARKIAVFNWPWYAAALAMNAAGIGWLAGAFTVPGPAESFPALRLLIGCAVAAADFWLLASFAVSHYVYDLSPLAAGAWLDDVGNSLGGGNRGGGVKGGERGAGRALRVAVLHAGQDEASALVTRMLPDASVRILDFHDPRRAGTGSLRRARARAARSGAEPVAAGNLPLGADSADLAVLAFSAHELRLHADRAALFRELRRAVGAEGRIRLVEHLRDGWNLLAYGPGAFHFLPRKAWERDFAAGGLRVAREWPCTPFVRVFDLEAVP